MIAFSVAAVVHGGLARRLYGGRGSGIGVDIKPRGPCGHAGGRRRAFGHLHRLGRGRGLGRGLFRGLFRWLLSRLAGRNFRGAFRFGRRRGRRGYFGGRGGFGFAGGCGGGLGGGGHVRIDRRYAVVIFAAEQAGDGLPAGMNGIVDPPGGCGQISGGICKQLAACCGHIVRQLFASFGDHAGGIRQDRVDLVLNICNAGIAGLHGKRKADPAHAEYQRKRRGDQLDARTPFEPAGPEHHHAQRPDYYGNDYGHQSVYEAAGPFAPSARRAVVAGASFGAHHVIIVAVSKEQHGSLALHRISPLTASRKGAYAQLSLETRDHAKIGIPSPFNTIISEYHRAGKRQHYDIKWACFFIYT